MKWHRTEVKLRREAVKQGVREGKETKITDWGEMETKTGNRDRETGSRKQWEEMKLRIEDKWRERGK